MYSRIALISVGFVTMFILWYILRKRTANRIHEPLEPLNLTGPMGIPGPVGPAGPAGSAGAFITVPSVPSTWQFARYVTIQHIPNGTKAPVSLADIQFFDNQNAEIRGFGMAFSSIKTTMIPSCGNYSVFFSNVVPRNFRLENALDRDLRTYFSTKANTDSEFIEFDLGREYPLSTIVIFNRPTCTEFHQTYDIIEVDPECRTRLNDCELELRDNNKQLFWSARFPTPPRDVYVFSL
jgi:hypothetical protein